MKHCRNCEIFTGNYLCDNFVEQYINREDFAAAHSREIAKILFAESNDVIILVANET